MRPKRRHHFFLVTIILLVVVLLASIVALWLRGFRWQDLGKTTATVTTPTLAVWAVQVPDYTAKMDAYKTAVSYSASGWAEYVKSDREQWSWLAAVYPDQETVELVTQDSSLPSDVETHLYQINGKDFNLAVDIAPICQNVLTTIQTITTQLQTLRAALTQQATQQNILIELSNSYNALKDAVTTLQQINQDSKSQFLACLIYSANINILYLTAVVQPTSDGAVYLSKVNTALINNIFSLDNF